MSSLADFPELVGFFSYSREDDKDAHGALSDLRHRIQGELRSQLGRPTGTFRIWQDKEAIPSGTLWETEINNAVVQSAFFIPIVTPTVVRSPYCQFEFNAFLTREAALGRSDLVFPILYIDVPALQDSVRRQSDPIISVIAKRQYVDWRELRHRDVNSMEVKEAVERFCRHIRNALEHPWLSPEERRQREEAAARQKAEAERQRQEDEAKRRQAAAERRKGDDQRPQEEAEAKRRAEKEERSRPSSVDPRPETIERSQEEKLFALAKRADTVAALDKFLSAYPAGQCAEEALALRVILLKREGARKVEPSAVRARLSPAPTPWLLLSSLVFFALLAVIMSIVLLEAVGIDLSNNHFKGLNAVLFFVVAGLLWLFMVGVSSRLFEKWGGKW